MKTTEEMFEVMQAHLDGKPIEVIEVWKNHKCDWSPGVRLSWDWAYNDYRVAVTKPSIDWDQVSDEFNWLAADEAGTPYIYKSKPCKYTAIWLSDGPHLGALGFSSFKPGTCDWKDSLVERPKK